MCRYWCVITSPFSFFIHFSFVHFPTVGFSVAHCEAPQNTHHLSCREKLLFSLCFITRTQTLWNCGPIAMFKGTDLADAFSIYILFSLICSLFLWQGNIHYKKNDWSVQNSFNPSSPCLLEGHKFNHAYVWNNLYLNLHSHEKDYFLKYASKAFSDSFAINSSMRTIFQELQPYMLMAELSRASCSWGCQLETDVTQQINIDRVSRKVLPPVSWHWQCTVNL